MIIFILGRHKMSYESELIRKEQHETNLWSGGTTTQLKIYPGYARYSERNFIWRLSSAKVETEESLFTSLPGIKRIIMIIDGKIFLVHEGHHKKVLEKFDQDFFNGSWTTKSYGKAVDFNLMMKEDCEGKLEAVHLDVGETKKIVFVHRGRHGECTQAIYCIGEEIMIKVSEAERNILNNGDIFLVKLRDNNMQLNVEVINSSDKKADFIHASIYY